MTQSIGPGGPDALPQQPAAQPIDEAGGLAGTAPIARPTEEVKTESRDGKVYFQNDINTFTEIENVIKQSIPDFEMPYDPEWTTEEANNKAIAYLQENSIEINRTPTTNEEGKTVYVPYRPPDTPGKAPDPKSQTMLKAEVKWDISVKGETREIHQVIYTDILVPDAKPGSQTYDTRMIKAETLVNEFCDRHQTYFSSTARTAIGKEYTDYKGKGRSEKGRQLKLLHHPNKKSGNRENLYTQGTTVAIDRVALRNGTYQAVACDSKGREIAGPPTGPLYLGSACWALKGGRADRNHPLPTKNAEQLREAHKKGDQQPPLIYQQTANARAAQNSVILGQQEAVKEQYNNIPTNLQEKKLIQNLINTGLNPIHFAEERLDRMEELAQKFNATTQQLNSDDFKGEHFQKIRPLWVSSNRLAQKLAELDKELPKLENTLKSVQEEFDTRFKDWDEKATENEVKSLQKEQKALVSNFKKEKDDDVKKTLQRDLHDTTAQIKGIFQNRNDKQRLHLEIKKHEDAFNQCSEKIKKTAESNKKLSDKIDEEKAKLSDQAKTAFDQHRKLTIELEKMGAELNNCKKQVDTALDSQNRIKFKDRFRQRLPEELKVSEDLKAKQKQMHAYIKNCNNLLTQLAVPPTHQMGGTSRQEAKTKELRSELRTTQKLLDRTFTQGEFSLAEAKATAIVQQIEKLQEGELDTVTRIQIQNLSRDLEKLPRSPDLKPLRDIRQKAETQANDLIRLQIEAGSDTVASKKYEKQQQAVNQLIKDTENAEQKMLQSFESKHKQYVKLAKDLRQKMAT